MVSNNLLVHGSTGLPKQWQSMDIHSVKLIMFVKFFLEKKIVVLIV